MAFMPPAPRSSLRAKKQMIPKESNIEPTVLAITSPSASKSTPTMGKMNEGIVSMPIPKGINMIALRIRKDRSFIV